MATIGHNNPPPEDAPFAIYRHEKLKTSAAIGKSARHMTRTTPTPNADPARADLNRVLIGTDDPAADAAALIPALGERDENGRLRRRSNSVLAIEVLLTASPEWWETATPEQQGEWVDQSTAWLVAEYGLENIAHLRIHSDERTPHLTGFIVPRDEDGHLNARAWIGGADRCAQQQTDYAKVVEHLGLRRGIEGSTAKHERVRRHYAQLEKPVAKLKVDRPPRVLFDPEGWAAEQRNNLRKQAGPVFARARVADSERTKRRAAEAQATKDRSRAERAQAALDEQKALAARLRALPLPNVLDALGFQKDPKEARWRADGFNITLGDGAKIGKWWDHAADYGRGGAIDLVQHTMGTDFKGALAWLADRFGPGAAAADLTAQMRAQAVEQVKEAIAERQAFKPPAPSPDHWPGVRQHLVESRALPRNYVDRLHELGDLYADARRNAVFVCRDPETGEITGAELKGTVTRDDGSRYTGMAPGSRKDLGGFRIGEIARATAVYLVESAIDAVSLFRLRQDAGERGHVVVSTAGTRKNVPPFLTKLADGVRRICAFDNDHAGDQASFGLRRAGWSRERPEGKDWNDDLRARRGGSGGDGAPMAIAALRPEGSQQPSPDPFVTTPDDTSFNPEL
jgi:hypothetical protein